jgi:hypothetical protein
MAWTIPATAVAGQPFTAAIYNAQMRDNLNATAPALATTISSWFTGSGINQISERVPAGDSATGSSTTTSTSYGNLADGVTTSVTVATGVSALVLLYANFNNSGTNNTWVSFQVSGATAIAATDNTSLMRNQTGGERFGAPFYLDNVLTPGSNTFTLRYRVSAGTGTFSVRRIGVIPF